MKKDRTADEGRESASAAQRGRPSFGRRGWAVVAAVVALLVVVGLPAYLATRPGFFARFPALKAQYAPWAASTHAEVACQECHVRPDALARASFTARMTAEFYATLLATGKAPDVFATPSDAACLVCHSDLRTVSPEGDLRIPHRAHVSILKMHCVTCHDFLVHEKSPEGRHTPTMSGCLRCHDGDKARNACSACHTEKAAPATHRQADWLRVHGAATVDAACEKCHAWSDDWCARCHAQRPRSHGTDWRAVHGRQVAAHRDCETCHEGPFCVRCHGEVPALNLDPKQRLIR